MYAKVHSYERLFRQAAKLATPRIAPAPVEKSETFTLVNDKTGYSFRFVVKAECVVVQRCSGRTVLNAWTKSKDEARTFYRETLARGFRRW